MTLDDEACRGRALATALEPFVGSVYGAPGARAAHPASPQEATMAGAVQDWVRGHGLPGFPGVPDRPDPVVTGG